jgi:hypothetical protein
MGEGKYQRCPSFDPFFQSFWNYSPFPWQRLLAERLVEGRWPRVLELLTAAGKTACIDVALYALAAQAEKPIWEHTALQRTGDGPLHPRKVRCSRIDPED